ncbi:MAG: class I SAM-dependent methyltransferase [Alphaproteobacteria bacterium]|nr:class I SAM-dependent methyltransferase [Alphaproteobacteria bacterium]
MIWLAIAIELILLVPAVLICIVMFKLLLVKGYRDYPPFVPSFGQTKKMEYQRLFEVLQQSTSKLKVLDPGCGTADLIIRLAKQFPQHQFVGIEWNKGLYKIAKLKSNRIDNVEILCQDMFDYSFADTDIIVCFLMEPLMEKLGRKIKSEGKSGLVVYSNTFKIPNLELKEKILTRKFLLFGNLYIYKL